VDGAPFDLSNNGGGYKTLPELVTRYILRELSEADVHRMWNETLKKVKGLWEKALGYIDDNPHNLEKFRNRYVRIHRPDGKRNNEFLSILVSYRHAKDRDTDRRIRKMETTLRSGIKEIGKRQPERLIEVRERTTKLLTGQSLFAEADAPLLRKIREN